MGENINNENNTENGQVINDANMEELKPHMKNEDNSTGAIAGSIIIIIIVLLGGFYFFTQRNTSTEEGMSGDEIRIEQDDATLDLETQSNSDEILDIEADLNTTELDNLDSELESIDSEFNF